MMNHDGDGDGNGDDDDNHEHDDLLFRYVSQPLEEAILRPLRRQSPGRLRPLRGLRPLIGSL